MISYRKHKIKQLEMHITHRCNLGCVGCNHYCDFAYKAPINPEAAFTWMENWAQRLQPETFLLLGGEPLLEPRLLDYVRAAADCFPNSNRNIVTNGLLLSKWEKDLPPILLETDTGLELSLYDSSVPEVAARLRLAVAMLKQWRDRHELRVIFRKDPQQWRKLYQGDGYAMLPFSQGRPEESFRVTCLSSRCLTLHQGAIWDCPTIAYLPMIASRLENKEAWSPYLAYRPLAFTAGESELKTFINKPFPECCAMCPVERHYIDHQHKFRPGLNDND